MRLGRIEIRDYRSIFADDYQDTFRLDLAVGANTLIGRNNCGKSNVLRAVSLALDPNHGFDAAVDIPGPRQFAHPIVVLEFVADGNRPEEQILLSAAKDYETEVAPHEPHHADSGRVVLEVSSFPPLPDGTYLRRELLRTPSGAVPQTESQRAMLRFALDGLQAGVRFVLIKSGESLESVLRGNFREILHSVIREQLDPAFRQAEQSRRDYVTGLQDNLLRPLRDRLIADVGGLFPEIEAIALSPDVQTIEQTLSNVDVVLRDLVETPLVGKGTGVRGGVLVAMLDYLARNATRGMVFAVEEPEAFLHPAAQEDLRDHLQELATTPDVTLLVTTHSPWMVSRSANSHVFCLYKDPEGRTRLGRSAAGSSPHAPLLGDLYRERTFADVLADATVVPDGTKAVLIVEGEGDEACLRRAGALVGRPDLLDGIDVRPAHGASKLALQAIVTREALKPASIPVLVLLDHDQPGRKTGGLLADSFGFQRKTQVLNYSMVFPAQHSDFPWEAEDLFEPEVMEGFVALHGEAVVVDGMRKRFDDRFHYDLNQDAKELLDAYFDERVRPDHVERWLDMILLIRKCAGLPDVAETPAELVAAAPAVPEPDQPAGGLVYVTTGDLALARYQQTGVLLLAPETTLADGVTHVAFYAGGEIKAPVPAILNDYPNLVLNEGTISQLRLTNTTSDAQAAEAIGAVLESSDRLLETSHHVVLLTGPDDPATFVLKQPIENTKQSAGKQVAWAVNYEVRHFSALAKHPTTTDQLDALDMEADR